MLLCDDREMSYVILCDDREMSYVILCYDRKMSYVLLCDDREMSYVLLCDDREMSYVLLCDDGEMSYVLLCDDREMNLERLKSPGKKAAYERRSLQDGGRRSGLKPLELCLMGAVDTIGKTLSTFSSAYCVWWGLWTR